MRRSSLRASLLAVALAGLAFSAAAADVASGLAAQNATRVSINASTYGVASGSGGYLGHAEAQAGAFANGSAAVNPAGFALTANAGGYGNAVAYNTVVGNATGSAAAGGWSDAGLKLSAAVVNPHGYVVGSGTADGGMYDPVRNGVDFSVKAGTAQDGAVHTTYAGGFAITGTNAQTPIAGGAALAQQIAATQYTDGTVNVGAVSFTGGAPVGQTAAERAGNTGLVVTVTASGFDPL